jgi:hypothetical protein
LSCLIHRYETTLETATRSVKMAVTRLGCTVDERIRRLVEMGFYCQDVPKGWLQERLLA